MTILIIGGGQAGLTTAEKYRAFGGADAVVIIGDEPVLPYQRPPLSKAYLAGEMPRERLYLRPQEWFDKNNIKTRCGEAVTAIDRAGQNITLGGGERLEYERLVLATGARARPLPRGLVPQEICGEDGGDGNGGDEAAMAAGLYTLRGLADIDAMRHEFQPGRRLLVIGGGYIGLEAAAIARKLGLEVMVVEAAPRILGRVASPATADYIRNLHESHGVIIREGIGIEAISVADGRVTGATLSDGSTAPADLASADFIIVGIGIIPNTELAEAAGLDCHEGILVDAYGRTSDPCIFAAGDCTRFDYRGEATRLESVGNAIDQGEVVAANLAGIDTEYTPKPWFWSDQYDMTLQIAGLNRGYDDTITRPGAKPGSMSVWYYAGERLIAVDAMGDGRAYMIGKRLIEAGKTIPKDVAADAEANLKDWL